MGRDDADARLLRVLTALEGRIRDRDDLVSISASVPRAAEIQIEPVPGSEELMWRRGGEERRIRRSQLAPGLAEALRDQPEFTITASERMHRMVINSDRGRISTRIVPSGPVGSGTARAAEPGTRQAFIDAAGAGPLLKALGIMAADGRIPPDRRRKLFQVDRFVELVDRMISEWPEGRILRVLDCASGRSYLSLVLNHYLTDVRRLRASFTCIDTDPALIESSRSTAEQLGYRNMDFVRSDIAGYRPADAVDMVMSLHACDTATDEALALGISRRAPMIVAVPCCHAALTGSLGLGSLEPLVSHGVFRGRLADLVTDGLRALCLESHGYSVSVDEYVSPLDTPKNLMIRASRSDRGGGRRAESYRQVCASLGVTPWIDRLLAGERPPRRACHHEGG